MKYILTILFSFFAINSFSQVNLDEFKQRVDNAPKFMVFYFYTDWCSVCKIQEKQIEKHTAIQEFLVNKVNYFKRNGEDQSSFTLNGKEFTSSTFIQDYLNTTHFNYPLWIILDQNYHLVDYYSGLISAKHFKLLMTQLNNNCHTL